MGILTDIYLVLGCNKAEVYLDIGDIKDEHNYEKVFYFISSRCYGDIKDDILKDHVNILINFIKRN